MLLELSRELDYRRASQTVAIENDARSPPFTLWERSALRRVQVIQNGLKRLLAVSVFKSFHEHAVRIGLTKMFGEFHLAANGIVAFDDAAKYTDDDHGGLQDIFRHGRRLALLPLR